MGGHVAAFVVTFLYLSSHGVFAQIGACSGVVEGSWYNLTALSYDPTGPAPPGYNYSRSSDIEFYINFCQPVSNITANSACNAAGASGACQQSTTDYFPAGLVQSELFVPYKPLNGLDVGVGIQYSNGSYCSGTGEHRTTTIYVTCDGTGAVEPHIYEETSVGCSYILYFISQYGCPTPIVSSSSSPTPSASPSRSLSASFSPSTTRWVASPSSSSSIRVSQMPTTTPTFTSWASQDGAPFPPWSIFASVMIVVAFVCLVTNLAIFKHRRSQQRQRPEYSPLTGLYEDNNAPNFGSVNSGGAQEQNYNDAASERGDSFVLAG